MQWPLVGGSKNLATKLHTSIVSYVLYGSMEEEGKPFPKDDPVLLQYPGRTPRARSWKAAWKTRNDILSVACLAVLLLVVSSFVVGFFVGKNIVRNETSGMGCSAHDMTYNWGANVSIGGESMRVVDWLDTNMTAENMMKNLL